MKKFLSGVVLLCCLLFVLLGASYALAEELQPEPESINAESFLNTYHDVDYSVPDYEAREGAVDLADTLPVAYDSRTAGNVTAVKNQNPYGSCWAFAATCAAESSLLATGATINGGESVTCDTLDLSELQLAYFFYNYDVNYLTNKLTYHSQTAADPLSLTTGDTTKARTKNYLDQGGNSVFTIWALASWLGGVKETTLPYSQASPELTVADSYAYNQAAAHMQNAYVVNFNNPADIKQLVIDYGAVAMSYYDDIVSHSSNNAYYQTKNGTNHAVSIIGWDDNYDKSNFNENCRPANNGAWLIKNSWGSSWGNAGCFWLSYEDASIQGCPAYAFVFEDAANYDNNYQHDGADGKYSFQLTQNDYTANVFTAQGSAQQRLDAVAIGLDSANVDYTVSVYKLADAASKPNSGELLATQSGSSTYVGYYTIKLNEPVVLNAGDVYSVVFKFNNDADIFYDDTYENNDWISFTSHTAAGQSYYSYTGTSWTDFSSENSIFRIKAFTNDVAGITLDLLDLTSSNSLGYLRLNHDYATTLTAINNTMLPVSISVTMGGTALTSDSAAASYYSYVPETGMLTVHNVTDNLVIAAQAVGKYTVTAVINDSAFGSVTIKNCVITADLNDGFIYADPAYSVVSATGNVTVEQVGDRFLVAADGDCTVRINGAVPDPVPAAQNVEVTEPNPSLTYEDRYVLTREITEGEYIILNSTDSKLFYYNIEPILNPADDYSAEFASINSSYAAGYQKWTLISAENNGYYLQLDGQYLYFYLGADNYYYYKFSDTQKSVFTIEDAGSYYMIVDQVSSTYLSVGNMYRKQSVALGELSVVNNYAVKILQDNKDVSGTNIMTVGGQPLVLTSQLTKPSAATDDTVTWNMFYSDCGMTVDNYGNVAVPINGGMGIVRVTGSFIFDGSTYSVINYVRITAGIIRADNIVYNAVDNGIDLDLYVPPQATAATVFVAVYNQGQLIGINTINQAAATAYENAVAVVCGSEQDTLKVFVVQTDSLVPLTSNLEKEIIQSKQ